MDRSESVDNTCPVCHEDMGIYAIGPCDHPVCYRCSTRMRVLCETADCPICRSLMPQVAFVHNRSPFKEINLRDCIPNRKNKIFYEDETIEEKYLNLLEFRCRLCPSRKSDRTFVLLQTHMRRDHRLFSCDLCLSNLKIFPFERKFYDRKNLATHRRLGDPDDKSYKGHPLCEFCDVRYNDKDELMKHLRKDHYYCHFCDQQGSNAYYNEYGNLKQHFADTHFLCTEDVCGDPHTQFTHAFSSEIDLKAHKAKMHNKSMSKFQSREARNIEVDFQFQPRRQGYGNRGANSSNEDESFRSNRGGDRYNNNNRRQNREDPQMLKALAESMEMTRAPTPPVQERVPDPVHDFPTLGGMPAAPAQVAHLNSQKPQPTEDFPSLATARSQGAVGQSQSASKAYASAMNFQSEAKPVQKEKMESRPVSLGSVSSISKERWNTHAPKVTDENFPSLGGRTPSSSGNSSKMGLVSDWSKSSSSVSEPSSNINIVSNRVSSEQNSKKVKLKPAKPILDKNLGDENEFPSLDGNMRDDKLLNNSLWRKPNNSKKANSNPRAQKFADDTFELPDSYYKSYELSGASQNGIKAERENVKKENVAPPVLSEKKDFPGLPTREAKKDGNAEKKVKTKPKEKKSEPKLVKPSMPKSKKSGGGSSLNDIAQGLVVNGDKAKQKVSDKSYKYDSQENKKAKSKPDWFENPETPLKKSANPPKSSLLEEESSSKSATPIDNSFPSLHTMSTPIQGTQVPPAPPGFATNSLQRIGSSVSAAPPGFTKPVAVAAPPPGFSFPKPSTPVTYIQPADFSARNQQLIKAIYNSLDTIEDGFQTFKSLSGQYRQGHTDGGDYYLSCQNLMGEADFCTVFPELIVLLPDVTKQQELWTIHQTTISNKPGQLSREISISPCSKCGQIVDLKDEDHHNLQHGEEKDFPTLGGTFTKSKGGKENKEQRSWKSKVNGVQ